MPIGFSTDGLLEIGAMVTYAQLMASSEVDVARPILAEVARTIADVQVRNCGTSAAMSVSTIRRTTSHHCSRASERRSLSAGRVASATSSAPTSSSSACTRPLWGGGRAADEGLRADTWKPGTGDAMTGLTLGAHGTYVVSAAATVGADGARVALGCVAATPVACDRDGGAPRRRGLFGGRRCARRPRVSAPRSIRLRDVHASAEYRRAPGRDLGHPRSRPASRRASEGMTVRTEPTASRRRGWRSTASPRAGRARGGC